jgi:hypothetical protein
MSTLWLWTMSYSADGITACVENLLAHGLDPRRVLTENPGILAYAPASVTEKINHLARLGVDPTKMASRQPRVLSTAPATISSRFALLQRHGLDVPGMADRQARLFLYSEDAVRRRLAVIYSAARAWGYTRSDANEIIERCPNVLGYKADRLRTLVRVASHAVTSPHTRPTPSDVGNILARPVEAVIIAALRDAKHINTCKDLVSRSQRLTGKATSEGELRALVEEHYRDHPALTWYWRAYPLAVLTTTDSPSAGRRSL